MPSRPDSAGAVTSQHLEVSPPSLFDADDEVRSSRLLSLLPRLSGMRDWLQTGWSRLEVPGEDAASATAASGKRLRNARAAFMAALADLDGAAAQSLANRGRSAHSLRELWHLRNELFTLVAVRHCETVAHQRLGDLNACFPSQSRRPARFSPSGPRTGLPSGRQELRP